VKRFLLFGSIVLVLLLAATATASAHIDYNRIRWHTRWTTTHHVDYETVTVTVRITNLSFQHSYDGRCVLRIYNASDDAFRAFNVSLNPRHYIERTYHANVDGTSPTHTRVTHCHGTVN
jgi:hypothetical protein